MDCAKRLLKKNNCKYNEEFLDQLIEWNATPRPDGYAPSAMLNGRITRSCLPALEDTYEQPFDQAAAAAARAKTAESSKRYYDKHAKDLPPLQVGERVVIFDEDKETWSIPGQVVTIDKNRHDRSVEIDIGGGAICRRNRRHVRPDRTEHSGNVPVQQQHKSGKGLTRQNSMPSQNSISPTAPRRSARLAAKANL